MGNSTGHQQEFERFIAEQKDRLLCLREQRFSDMKAAADAYGIGYETLKKYNTRRLQPDDALKIANYHGVSVTWLMFGMGPRDAEYRVPLIGSVIESGKLAFFDQDHITTIETITTIADCFALYVDTDSNAMYPLVRAGDYAFFSPLRAVDTALIGKECAIELATGEAVFKILERGSAPGLYDLHSYVREPRRDVEVLRAGRFLAVRRNPGWPAPRG